MYKKHISLLLVLVMLATLLCACAAKQTDTSAEQKTISVTVVHADKSEKTFTYTSTETYLDKVLLAEGLIPAGNIVDGMFTIVDGEEASWQNDQAYWAFYIGEDYALVGICDTKIEPGASYRFVYTK